ncbi:MAG: protein kinase [Deltaproteobacteria bacterium]|nr:protein kinase [Deltaproteobacteria bacterium]
MKPLILPHKMDNDYELLELLGEGLRSRVFLGKRENESVAIKLLNLLPDRNQKERIHRFKKEFSRLKQLSHPHINKVFDFGYDDGLKKYYCIGELIRGEDLKTACQTLSVQEIEGLFVQALQALYYLHTFDGAGLRHNDIKPSNILVEKTIDGKLFLKLIDFGLTRFAPLPIRGGTLPYMAPEQIAVTFPHAKQMSFANPDQRADLYSLGVVWYFCLTGINPFLLETDPSETLQRHFDYIPPPPSSFRPEIPAYMDKIILNLLKKNPEERFDGADEVIREINRLSGSSYSVVPNSSRSQFLPDGKWIGRKEAWQTLTDLWNQVKTENSGPMIVHVYGEKGTGKSKILELLKNHVQTDEGQVLQWSSDLPKIFQDRTKPTLIVLDDFHKEHTARQILKNIDQTILTPSLIVLTSSEKVPMDINAKEIILDDFSIKDIGALLKEYGEDNGTAPTHLLRQLMDYTRGNPQSVFSCIRSLFENGYLLDEHGHWQASLLHDMPIDLRHSIAPKGSKEIAGGTETFQNRVEHHLKQKKTLSARQLIEEALAKEASSALNNCESLTLRNLLAKSYVVEGNIEKGISIYKETREASKQLPPEQRLKITNNDLGYCYFLLQQGDDALETLEEDLGHHLLASPNSTRLTRCYYLLGATARVLKKDFNKAIFYYRKCEENARDTKDIERLMRAYHGLAATYLDRAHSGDQTNAYAQATAYFEKSLAIAIRLKGTAHQTDEEISAIRLTMAMVYQECGMLEKTKEHVESIIATLENKKVKSKKTWLRLCQSYLLLADTHANADKWDNAAICLLKAEGSLKKKGMPAELKFGSRLLRARLCQKSGDIEGLKKHLSTCERLKKKNKIQPTPTAEKYLTDLHKDMSQLQGQNSCRHNIATINHNILILT